MNSRLTLVIILILTACLTLAAGCVGQVGEGKNIGNVPSTVSIASSIPIPMQIESSVGRQEGYYWIKIDPIGDKHVGDTFTVMSTTNLSAGKEILVQVYKSTFSPGIQRKFYGTGGTVSVVQGSSGINTISFVVNTSEFKPDEYIVTEDATIQPATGTALFHVLPAPVAFGETPLKPKNFIDWEKLDLPPLKMNNSMQPEIPEFSMNFNADSQYQDLFYYGSIVVFSPDGIARFYDKNGTQIAAYYDFGTLRSYALPSGANTSRPVGNVTTFTYGSERLLTLIFEASD